MRMNLRSLFYAVHLVLLLLIANGFTRNDPKNDPRNNGDLTLWIDEKQVKMFSGNWEIN